MKAYLSKRWIEYTDRDINQDVSACAELAEMNAPGVPVIRVRAETVVGFNQGRLAEVLQANGVAGPRSLQAVLIHMIPALALRRHLRSAGASPLGHVGPRVHRHADPDEGRADMGVRPIDAGDRVARPTRSIRTTAIRAPILAGADCVCKDVGHGVE